MSEVTFEQALQLAETLFQSHRLDEADQLCQKLLNAEPNDLAAIHLLSKVSFQRGHRSRAIELINRAITVDSNQPEFHLTLGIFLRSQGQIEPAVRSYRRALSLRPDFAEAHYSLGNLWQGVRNFTEAISSYQRAIELRNGFVEAINNLGNVLRAIGRFDEAVGAYQNAISIRPDFVDAYHNLGGVFQDLGRFGLACECYQKVITVGGETPQGYMNLGAALHKGGNFDAAIAAYQRVLAIAPDHLKARMNLGSALKDIARVDESIRWYRDVLRQKPDHLLAGDNLLLALEYHPASTPQSIHAEFLNWNQQHAKPLAGVVQAHTNHPNRDRRLRVGYVSPDLGNHPIGWFLLPLLREHDRSGFEVFCYSQRLIADEVTAQLREQTQGWRDIHLLSDEEVADAIRADGIDILVNLAMHSAKNRLLVFARKPAPVQVAYLGYAGGTALDTIDYRLTDWFLDPDEAEDRFYMEKSVRLRGTYWCYEPFAGSKAVNDLPALSKGIVTFCCLNNFSKVNDKVLGVWADLLANISGSMLLLHCPVGSHRSRVLQMFERRGVSSGRIELIDRIARADYLDLYLRADIALDPFPFCGGTTTCDALWMGVPVVTLKGNTPVGRAGVSILSNVGLTELIAGSTEQYIRIAVELAGDLPRLSALRGRLRQQMETSALMDAPAFARNIEAAYRQMWHNWCETQAG